MIAPPLSFQAWIKGEPVSELPVEGIAVLEFWATWCGPCVEAIPLTSAFAEGNPDVLVIGVATYEDDPGVVEDFVEDMGPRMAYRVAWAGDDDSPMAQAWQSGLGATSVPTAFVVRDRRVVWIGPPEGMETAVESLRQGEGLGVSGTPTPQ